ncbi:MAG: methylenetetrahydrofolate reductase C-terminal domain-containing protein [Syntrophales bacterium]|nr:methylenetetrahydrofolate reductase C-terminal domain-containing protein [Syntrophales bacterium]MDD5640634.1 methylenetetrahydrofolate reductase C-terminal domain-containing protein [Syntrophales bacterium]
MIGTTKKPFPEIMAALEGYQKVAVVGCDGCAKVCLTGGTDEVAALAQELRAQGKEIVFEACPERTCNVVKADPVLAPLADRIKEAEALLVLGCGGAVQITRELTEKYGITVPVKTGLNSVGHMDTLIGGTLAVEQCQECGDCILNETGGICPVTKCAKGLLNGPCGGAEDGKCEVDPSRDCAWILIYKRMAALGETAKLKKFTAPKDYSKAAKPRVLHIKEGRVA